MSPKFLPLALALFSTFGTGLRAQTPATPTPNAAPPAKATPAPEVEIPFPADLQIPPATVLSPEETLKTLKLPAGFRAELVASEPMITTPVAMQFDEDGRLWVVEMNGYMPNVDGRGEDVPNGRIVVLEDTNSDGRMDKSTVFLDKLVLPRAISLRKGGALICEPPNVYWCADANHDLVADGKEPVIVNYTSGGNPEHQPNGLLLAMDNWLYNAKSSWRYRFTVDGQVRKDTTAFRGQWGITQDDYGRIYSNTNSDQLRGDMLPSAYLSRNPNLKGAEGANLQVAKSQKVFPGRVTPGTNRAYQPGALKNGKLVNFTAACGPLIYRGDLFPREFAGNSFVCDTSINLVKRNVHTETDGLVSTQEATDKFATPGLDFLTSTSERFRPVNLANGPDGALYVADMARGVVQHITYVSPWLRRQILERGLEQPLEQGRIWRIVPDGVKRAPGPKLSTHTPEQLVADLGSANGWTRDTAQRLLVERGGGTAVPALKKMVAVGKSPAGRTHALWTLEGLEKLDAMTLTAAFTDPDPKVRATAIRLAEPLAKADPAVAEKVFALAADKQADVQLQLLLSLGEIRGAKTEAVIATVLSNVVENSLARSAALSSLRGQELGFIKSLLTQPAWAAESKGRQLFLAQLTRCILEERKAERAAEIIAIATTPPKAAWQQLAMLDGLATPSKNFKPLPLAAEPTALTRASDPETKKSATKIAAFLTWPGKPGATLEKKAVPLTPEQKAFVEQGAIVYNTVCTACHLPQGQGQEGLAPPLAGSEWVSGPESRLIRIVLHGVGGKMEVAGKIYTLDMPGLAAALTDEQIAQALSYTRRSFGHEEPIVETATVEKARAGTKDRGASWTADELLQMH